MEVIGKLDMTVPLWGILISMFGGAWFIIGMNNKMQLMEKDMSSKMELMDRDLKSQNKELREIKELLYKFIRPLER